MNTSGIIRLELQSVLKFLQVPLRQFLVGMLSQCRQHMGDLLIEVSDTILLFLDILLDNVGENFPKHGYQVVDR